MIALLSRSFRVMVKLNLRAQGDQLDRLRLGPGTVRGLGGDCLSGGRTPRRRAAAEPEIDPLPPTSTPDMTGEGDDPDEDDDEDTTAPKSADKAASKDDDEDDEEDEDEDDDAPKKAEPPKPKPPTPVRAVLRQK